MAVITHQLKTLFVREQHVVKFKSQLYSKFNELSQIAPITGTGEAETRFDPFFLVRQSPGAHRSVRGDPEEFFSVGFWCLWAGMLFACRLHCVLICEQK